MNVGVTGHRPDKLGGWDPLHPVVDRVKRVLRLALVDAGPSALVTGMALGVDQWAAQEALELGIPFVAAVPCDGMDDAWPSLSRKRFHALLERAQEVVVVAPGPYKPWKMQKRNEWVVDHCELLLAVHDGSAGGTFNCLQYARGIGRTIRCLDWHEPVAPTTPVVR